MLISDSCRSLQKLSAAENLALYMGATQVKHLQVGQGLQSTNISMHLARVTETVTVFFTDWMLPFASLDSNYPAAWVFSSSRYSSVFAMFERDAKNQKFFRSTVICVPEKSRRCKLAKKKCVMFNSPLTSCQHRWRRTKIQSLETFPRWTTVFGFTWVVQT